MGPEQSSPSNPQTESIDFSGTPDRKLFITVRGMRGTGKTSLIGRMKGLGFNDQYIQTPSMVETSIMWRSPKGELIEIIALDAIDKYLSFNDMQNKVQRKDASSVDTIKDANGLVIMIDTHKSETIEYASQLLSSLPYDLPVVIFSNFQDDDDISPTIPDALRQKYSRFNFIPGSAKTGIGLLELSEWIEAPLLASKRREYLNQYTDLCNSLQQLNEKFALESRRYLTFETMPTIAERSKSSVQKPNDSSLNVQSNDSKDDAFWEEDNQPKITSIPPKQLSQQSYGNMKLSALDSPKIHDSRKIDKKFEDDDDFWNDDENEAPNPMVVPSTQVKPELNIESKEKTSKIHTKGSKVVKKGENGEKKIVKKVVKKVVKKKKSLPN